MNWIGYDIETEGDEDAYALQPWRVREGSSRITLSCTWANSVAVLDEDSHGLHVSLEQLREAQQRVATWNGVFDLSFLYASGHDISGIMWYDAMLLWKWLENAQTGPMSWHLADGAKRFLKDWDRLDEFIEIKAQPFTPGQNDEYWKERVHLDAQATAMIAEAIWPQLTKKQQKAATIQAYGLPTVAASWVNGVHVDLDKIVEAEAPIIMEMLGLEIKLGLTHSNWISHVISNGIDTYVPSKVLRSPQQLAALVYDQWKLPCTRYTEKTKKKSADKTALTYLADHDDRILDILKWRELNTIWTKFIKGPIMACEYLGNQVTHSNPRVFSTYTGRMTYSSKQQRKFRIGVPLHQTPRKKEIRSYVVAPPGYYIVEFDAKGQEMRGMATVSGDRTMIDMFNSEPPYDNGHARTGAAIGNMGLREFVKLREADDPVVTGPKGLYLLGKFNNLSIQYRTGLATLRLQARVQYNIDATVDEIKIWKQKYLNLYPGVKDYWLKAPANAKLKRYAETIAGRRYGITRYSEEYVWGSDSSAINFPIQGMGADQRDLAIAVMASTFVEVWDKMYFDLHDGLYWLIPVGYPVTYVQKMLRTLNEIDYSYYWGVDLPVPYIWECSLGPDWGHKKDLELNELPDQTLEEYYESV